MQETCPLNIRCCHREDCLPEADLLISQGMLASAATIETVAETLKEYDIKTIVLDPVGGVPASDGFCWVWGELIQSAGDGLY